jgi:FlaA1/EpsC-like NDP-sugar epimerase
VRRTIVNLVDALGILGALFLAAEVRFEGTIPIAELILVLLAAPSVVLGKLFAIRLFQCDRWSFRYAGPSELRRLLAALSLGTLLGWAVVFLVGPDGVSRAALLMEPLFSLFILGAFRFGLRVFPDRSPAATRSGKMTRNILILGAGEAGVMTLREILHHPASDMTVVGFIDDDPKKKGIWIEGVRVIGGREEIPAAVEALKVEEVVIAIPSAGGEMVRELVSACKAVKTRFRVVPGLLSIIRGDVAYDRIREFRPEDLLGRETTEIDPASFTAELAGRRVLVTGAGGSIGAELARQLKTAGAELILLDHSETAIYLVGQELKRSEADRVVCRIADLRNEERIRRILADEKPEIVFHAAAFKHVPLMEENVSEAIATNIVGTRHLVRAAEETGVERFVFISTDKAVRPTSVMGATKRAAEMLLLSRPHGAMRIAAVRFGNVFGSSGSAPLLFRRQIEAGGPVTVTHPHVVRYFMTISEAVFLVIQAALLGEERDLFVLEMGQAVRILDLARNMITLAGRRPEIDIPIIFTGLRPGEKLFEEVLTEDEHIRPTPVKKVHRIARTETPLPELERTIDELAAASLREDDTALRERLRRFIPDFRA